MTAESRFPLNVSLRPYAVADSTSKRIFGFQEHILFELMQHSVETCADEVFWMTAESQIVYANQSACQKLEYSYDELIGLHVWEWDPLFPKEVWPSFWQSLKAHKALQFETQHRTKSGRVFPVEIHAIFHCHGDTELLLAFVNDISERRQQEARDKKVSDDLASENVQLRVQLQDLVRNVPGAFIQYSETTQGDMQVEFVSPGCEQIWELNVDELSGNASALWEQVVPQDIPVMQASIEQSKQTLQQWECEWQIVTPRGNKKWLRGVGNPRRLDNGTVVWSTYVSDVTESRNLLESLKLSQRINKTATWYFDLEADSVWWSPELFRMFDLPEADTAPPYETHHRLFAPHSWLQLEQAVANAVENGVPYELKLELSSKNKGKSRFAVARCEAQCNEDGKPVRLVGTFQDVSTLVETEKRLRQTLRQLDETIIAQKTLEESLRQAQKMEAIGQLAGGVAHDFNNQLTSMLGYAEILKQRLLNPELEGIVDKIINAAERSSNLTKQLLSFSRKQHLQLTTVDLHAEILDTLDIVNVSFDKRIETQHIFNAEDAYVLGDKSLLQNVLLNLCLNARDAMPSGGVLTLATQIREVVESTQSAFGFDIKPGQYIAVTVSDTGVGISANDIPHLFEPFFTTKPTGQGTGMGLASVFGMVKQHHGFIDVDSREGQGTSFTVCFPFVDGQVATEARVAKDSVSDTAHDGATILLVDDEPEIRAMCYTALTEAGYRVLLAKNGQEGVEQYYNNDRSIDLVILDMIMPVMHGKDALLKIQARNPKAKVLIASGFDSALSQTDALPKGVLGLIEKPFSIATLLSNIKLALAK